MLEEFDRGVFESIVEKVIVGEMDENGNKDPYKLTFVYKTGISNKVEPRMRKNTRLGESLKAGLKKYVPMWQTGLSVSSLYISQIKRKCGLEVGQNYHLAKNEDAKMPQCPLEKEKATREAFAYFGMISLCK